MPAAASAARLDGSVRIPLNDDRREKAQRTHSRQLLHEAQMNSLRAAATPARKRRSLLNPNLDGPSTPSREDFDSSQLVVTGSVVTPMKRAPPVLARYEEWMKLVTDNKLTATNSWDIGLIDYFKDMSLLKEGDGINFQKASWTLDGCVKIYTNRVDNVVTETDKLRNGLADSSDKTKKTIEHEAGEEEDVDDEHGGRKRSKRKVRSHEATLVKDFAQIQLKKMDLEFAVDPLFKKASADFDEGGAKGLLLNNLCIDSNGRIVFDSSDDTQYSNDDSTRDSMQSRDKVSGAETDNLPVDVAALGARYFPHLSVLDQQDVCPSLKMFELGNGDGTLDLPFLRADDWKKDIGSHLEGDFDDDARSGIVIGDDNADGFDGIMDGFDLPADTGFGQGGEVWANALNLRPEAGRLDPDPVDQEGEGHGDLRDDGELDARSRQFGVSLVRHEDAHENILAYFDNALKKNWAGPEHWKIQKVKEAAEPNATPAKRREKEPFEIDFNAPMDQKLADVLFTQAPTAQSINLPKAQWKSRTKNLLPNDKHFNSRTLLHLFLKPKARFGPKKRQFQRSAGYDAEPEPRDMDEAYWAHRQANTQADGADAGPGAGVYDASFFQDGGMPFADGHDGDDDVFDDAPEMPRGDTGADNGMPPSGQASQGLPGRDFIAASQRARPQFIQYARVAKKVDVRKLKDNMWRGIGFGPPPPQSDPDTDKELGRRPSSPTPDDATLKFRDVISNLSTVYPSQQMADISTSYCFIALLHLANEKGLTITNQEGFTDLTIRRDPTAEITDEIDA